MRYVYFVVYTWGGGTGTAEMGMPNPIASVADITALQEAITVTENKGGRRIPALIVNYILLRTETLPEGAPL